jgi:signal peptidase II
VAEPAPLDAGYRKTPRTVVFAAVALVCAALDLATKEVALDKLARRTPEVNFDDRIVVLIERHLEYRYTLNPGVIFGRFQQYGQLFFWIAIAAVPVLIAIFWRIRRPSASMSISLAMILGGTVGNLVDRFRFDAVQDFIYVRSINFPIFNIADSCILIGTILLMSELTVFDEKKKKKDGGGSAHDDAARPGAGQPADAAGPPGPG